MISRGSKFLIAERASDVVLSGAALLMAIYDPKGLSTRLAVPVIAILLIVGWVSAWHRGRKPRAPHRPSRS